MRILVTGGGGLIGSALARMGVPALSREELDVTNPSQRDKALEAFEPDAVIFCAAIADVDRCQTDRGTLAVNVDAPIAFSRHVPTWLVSTNYVFDGPGPHHPLGTTSPCNAYGEQKRLAEEGVLENGGHVVRTGWVYGPGGRNFPSSLPRRLREGRVEALTDWKVQPTWADDLAMALLDLSPGITHAIGSQETTWAEFALAVAERMGLANQVEAVPQLALGPRPQDARLAPATLPGWQARIGQLVGLG